jgi:hypothetical protein
LIGDLGLGIRAQGFGFWHVCPRHVFFSPNTPDRWRSPTWEASAPPSTRRKRLIPATPVSCIISTLIWRAKVAVRNTTPPHPARFACACSSTITLICCRQKAAAAATRKARVRLWQRAADPRSLQIHGACRQPCCFWWPLLAGRSCRLSRAACVAAVDGARGTARVCSLQRN